MVLKFNPTTGELDMMMNPGYGTATTQIDVDSSTAPGTDPTVPAGDGSLTLSGAAVSAHSVPLETHSRAANTINIEVQVASDRTGAPANTNDAGICSFDDTQFTVDSNGYVQLAGGGLAVDSLSTDVAGPVAPDLTGNIDVTGTSIFSDGTVANTLTLNVQSTANTFLLGAGVNATSTELGPLTNGQLIIGSTGASPSLSTITEGEAIDITNGAGTITIACESATDSNLGVVELSTDAEAQLLADTTRVLTPANMGAVFALENQSGFYQFTGAGSIYTVSGTDFTLDRAGQGWIDTKLVTWSGGQTVASLSKGNTHYIYIDSTGTIGSSTSRTTALFQNNIVLFQVLVDNDTPANVLVAKENHSLDTHPSTMNALHNLGLHGYSIEEISGGTISLNGTVGIQVDGDSAWYDHDLRTEIPDSSAAAVTFNIFYTDGTGKWVLYASQNTLPTMYNNAGTPTALAGNERSIFDIRVAKDDIESSSPQYIAVMSSSKYANLALAQAAVDNGTYTSPTNELMDFENIQMGIVIMNAIQIDEVTVAKQTIGAGNATFTGSTGASISLDTTNFDKNLSAADTTVQAALETLDELSGVGLPGSSTDNAIVRWDGAGGDTIQNSVVTIDDSGNLSTAANIYAGDGTTAAPSLSFVNDPDTGFNSEYANSIRLILGGSLKVNFTGTVSQWSMGLQGNASKAFEIRYAAGAAGTPSFTFRDDTNTGMYQAAADQLDFSCNGTRRFGASSAGVFDVAGSVAIDPGASGDSFVQFNINTTGEFRIGVDDDDGDAFKISQGSALGANDCLTITADGEVKKPLQPAFQTFDPDLYTNVTGDDTIYTLLSDTELFDRTSDYDTTTGKFTAPTSGIYHFSCGVTLVGLAGHTYGKLFLNVDYNGGGSASYIIDTVSDTGGITDENYGLTGDMYLSLSASDDVYLTVQSGATGKDVSAFEPRFGGNLVC